MKGKQAIILCSGGLDSVITAYFVKNKLKYSDLIILFFDYGQKSLKEEKNCSKASAKNLSAKFKDMNLRELNKLSNSLINKAGKVKRLSLNDLKDTSEESRKWYVPARNLLFLSYAISLAESYFAEEKKRHDIFVGFKCEGKEAYPDTTKKFVRLINKISESSTSGRFNISAPLINKDKEDIIRLGVRLGVDFKKTFSCYLPRDGKHCGCCLACRLRQAGFYWAGVSDPTVYFDNN